jgi:RNA polymerase sigma-32 factor
VVKVALEYGGYGMSLSDLVQEGNLGLVRAVKTYDPEKGYRLISYAVWWIKACIHEHIMRSWSLVRIGTTRAQRKLFFKLRSVREEADKLAEPGDGASTQVMAKMLDVSEDTFSTMEARLAARDFSLNKSLKDERTTTYLDQLEAESTSPEDDVGRAEEYEILHKGVEDTLDDLDERERYIVSHRLMSDEPMTLREIGRSFHISRERTRQVQERVLAKLRIALVGYGLEAA